MRKVYEPPVTPSVTWFGKHFPDSAEFMKRQPAAAPLLWALGGIIAAFLSGKEYTVTIGIVIAVVVMASRPAAVFIDALREHPNYKRRRALKRAAPDLFAFSFLTVCLAMLLEYFKVRFAIGFVF